MLNMQKTQYHFSLNFDLCPSNIDFFQGDHSMLSLSSGEVTAVRPRVTDCLSWLCPTKTSFAVLLLLDFFFSILCRFWGY